MDKDTSSTQPLNTPSGNPPYPTGNPPYPTGPSGMPQPSVDSMQPPMPPPPYSPRQQQNISNQNTTPTTTQPQAQTQTRAQQPQMTTVIVTGQQSYTFGSQPQRVVCYNCRYEGLTMVKTEMSGGGGTCLGWLLCCLGCWICACFMCCLDSFRVVNHYCPNCKIMLGSQVM